MHRILLVEDDADHRFSIEKSLGSEHVLKSCASLSEASRMLTQDEFDLILLDVMLPDGDGFQFLAQVRNTAESKKPMVLFITGKSSVSDQVMGYMLGAEDYVVKPIHPAVLKAKVNAKLRHLSEKKQVQDQLKVGNLLIDQKRQKAWIENSENRMEMDLTPLEFKILYLFACNIEHVFSREQLLNSVWGENVHIVDRTVDTHMSHLRKKLARCRSSHTIDSVHGVGYRLIQKPSLEETGNVSS